MDHQSGPGDLVLSYLGLRKAVGIIGLALPFVLALGRILLQGCGLETSISSYYYTDVGNVFVGSLCAIGVFLMSYRYGEKDTIAGRLASIFAVGVALLPTTPSTGATCRDKIIGAFHLTFAALLFLTLAYFCLKLFTLTDPNRTPTLRKLQRNRVYRICGYTILASIALIAVAAIPAVCRQVGWLKPRFWLESVAVVAFGAAWLIKGETILMDKQPQSPDALSTGDRS